MYICGCVFLNDYFSEIIKKTEEFTIQSSYNKTDKINNKEKKCSTAKTERFYVTNAKLLEQLQIWKDSGKILKKGQWLTADGKIAQIDEKTGLISIIAEEDNRDIPEEFGKMVLMIAKRLSNHSNFKKYPYEVKQDMISYACFKCIQGICNYNFKFKNAFAYFTTACYNAFISVVTAYYKHINIRKDLLKRALERLESTRELNSNKAINLFLKEYIGEDAIDNEPEE